MQRQGHLMQDRRALLAEHRDGVLAGCFTAASYGPVNAGRLALLDAKLS